MTTAPGLHKWKQFENKSKTYLYKTKFFVLTTTTSNVDPSFAGSRQILKQATLPLQTYLSREGPIPIDQHKGF